MRIGLMAALAGILIGVTGRVASGQCEPEWLGGFGPPGARDGPATAQILTVFAYDSPGGPAALVGGVFRTAGGVNAANLAYWRAGRWYPLATSMTNDAGSAFVVAMAAFDGGSGPALYAAGAFTSVDGVAVNNIARWDGSSWSPLGLGVEGGRRHIVHSLLVFDDGSGPALYVAGDFTLAGGATANNVAKWDGVTWAPLADGVGPFGHDAYSLAIFDDGTGLALYAGGSFWEGGGGVADFVARWDGQQWHELGCGILGPLGWVSELAVYDDGSGPALYAGGLFNMAGCQPASNIARWDGAEWSSGGAGIGDPTYSLATLDNGAGPGLYAGTSPVQGNGTARVLKWDAVDWTPLGTGMAHQTGYFRPSVSCLALIDLGSGPAIYAAGIFDYADGGLANSIARWDGQRWLPLGNGFEDTNNRVQSLAVANDGTGPALYAGGSIYTVEPPGMRGIVKWDNGRWSSVGGGIAGDARAIAELGDESGPQVYVGGAFTAAGGVSANRIASWNGSLWSPLGAGMDRPVEALAVFDGGAGPALFAAGSFRQAGTVTTNGIALWRAGQWSAVGGGLSSNASARAVAVFHDGSGAALYVGGSFAQAGGVTVNNLGRWNGASWSGVGGGLNGTVEALAVFDDGNGPALVAAGWFTLAGGRPASRIARWDGAAWSALDGGVNNGILALQVHDDGSRPALYATGAFLTAGGVTANGIARWDGVQWSALDVGLDDNSFASDGALASFDDGSGPALWIGGEFDAAGGVPSRAIAKWGCPAPPCEPCDANCDGAIDAFDIEPFIGVVFNGDPPCDDCAGDANRDGEVNAFDIEPFIDCLFGP